MAPKTVRALIAEFFFLIPEIGNQVERRPDSRTHCHTDYPTLSQQMKLDVTDLRYVTSEEFRVLTAVRAHILSV